MLKHRKSLANKLKQKEACIALMIPLFGETKGYL